jgi:hypothetical protein
MAYQTVRYEVKGPLCHIVLNRPEKLSTTAPTAVPPP